MRLYLRCCLVDGFDTHTVVVRCACLVGGSSYTEFAPDVFRYIRACCGISDADLYASLHLSVEAGFRGRAGEGKGGATFFPTADGRFVVKSVTAAESAFLLQILPAYASHLARHHNSLLQPLCALIHVQRGDERLRAVVMPDLFITGVDERYGHRTALHGGKPAPTPYGLRVLRPMQPPSCDVNDLVAVPLMQVRSERCDAWANAGGGETARPAADA